VNLPKAIISWYNNEWVDINSTLKNRIGLHMAKGIELYQRPNNIS
jgi:hypothetical protein